MPLRLIALERFAGPSPADSLTSKKLNLPFQLSILHNTTIYVVLVGDWRAGYRSRDRLVTQPIWEYVQMSRTALTIAIIGAGFSAHAAAIALIRNARQPMRIALIDPREECGGLAYGRADNGHILNTRASHFSVLPDAPFDFVAWARDNVEGLSGMEGVEDAYLPRRHVQAYIRARLAETLSAHPQADVLRVKERVSGIDASPSGFSIRLSTGSVFESDVTILATGYGPDRRLNFGLDPFGEISVRRASRARRIAFIGSGLTFMDGYLRIRALGFRGHAVSYSRSARLPAPHASHHAPPIRLGLPPGTPLRSILRAARERSDALTEGEDWRSLVNGLRLDAQQLWQGLSPSDKARFDRHLRSIWDRLRHRAPPHIHASVKRDVASGALRLEKARVTTTRHGFNGWSVDVEHGADRNRIRGFDLVFDCSGPSTQSIHPLISPLLDGGFARPGPGGAGIDVLPSGAVIAEDGSVTAGLYAIGPLGSGSLLEITAAPEIVAQADTLAREATRFAPGTIVHTVKPKETPNVRPPSRREARHPLATTLRPARSGSGR